MKKSFSASLSFAFILLLATLVIAQQKGPNENKTPLGNLQGNETPMLIKTQEIKNMTRNIIQQIREQEVELKEILKNYSNLSLEEREQVREEIRNQIRLIKENITQLKADLEAQVKGLKEQERVRVENTNRVRLAVQTLLAMENLTGGIGRNVSEIARNFNNSIQSTLRHEEKIQNRNKVLKFLFGRDLKTVKQLENETLRLQEMINSFNKTIESCEECTEEVKEMLQEQLMLMQQEQQRLQQLVQKEKKIKGLFGWIIREK
jgi:superfamily II DNA helicase RecQ